jgi:glycosyltransferase involved in cell wall biosynthesis
VETISVAIIAQDEEEVLPVTLECLVPLKDILKDVWITDGFSKDYTVRVARSFSDRLPIRMVMRPFDTFKDQKNYALQWCGGDWVLGLDADMAFNSLDFLRMFTEGFFYPFYVFDFALLYTRGDMKHYDVGSTSLMPTTRLWRNCGLRYERDVHEYLVFPGEHGPESIHQSGRMRATGEITIFENSLLKSAKGLRSRVERYKRWAEKSQDAGINIEAMAENTEAIIADRWNGTAEISPKLLAGVPEKAFDYPLSRGELA